MSLKTGSKPLKISCYKKANWTVVRCVINHNLQKLYLPTHLLTPWSRDVLEDPLVSQLVKKFLAFYRTRKFITAFTSSCHLSLSSKTLYYIINAYLFWRYIILAINNFRSLSTKCMTKLRSCKQEYGWLYFNQRDSSVRDLFQGRDKSPASRYCHFSRQNIMTVPSYLSSQFVNFTVLVAIYSGKSRMLLE